MPATASLRKKATISDTFIYEKIDGKPYYYQGYKSAIKNKQTVESIMGYGLLQWMIIDAVMMYLKLNLSKTYKVLSGEGGFHLKKNDNLSLDIAILDKSQIDFSKIENKYLHIAPKVVVEVDTKADFSDESNNDYFFTKTQKLLDEGVEQVVWILTSAKKIMVAKPNSPWLTVNWSYEIDILGIKLILKDLLEQEGIQ